MIETIVAAALVAGGVGAATRTPASTPRIGPVPHAGLELGPDLPCPWCHSETDESDVRCRSCGQRFG